MNTSPRILFFNINGSGMGHMNCCLAYARRLQGKSDIMFFSLASAIEFIEEMGFPAEYFVSYFWSNNTTDAWNTELALRLGLVLDRFKPDVLVFDGTWPYMGLLSACRAYGKIKLVWSRGKMFKPGTKKVQVDDNLFDIIIELGELGEDFSEHVCSQGKRRFTIPPLTLLHQHELLDREQACNSLGLSSKEKHVLFTLGAGNINNINTVSNTLMERFMSENYHITFAAPPISVQDIPLPSAGTRISVYPLAKYMRAFDLAVSATGYSTSTELVQTQIPCLLVPNSHSADDQVRRAHMVARHAPAVVSFCETKEETDAAVRKVLQLAAATPHFAPLALNGADLAAEAILALAMR